MLNEQITIEGTNITMFALVGGELDQPKIVSSGRGFLNLVGIKSTSMKSLLLYGSTNFSIRNSNTLVVVNIKITTINGSGFAFENISNIIATNVAIFNSPLRELISQCLLLWEES